MKKLLLSALAIALTLTAIPQFVLAGGIDNKQNFSARYVATGSRNAAIDGADIAAYNPAGIMMKEDNGFIFQADVQYILKDYEQDVDNTAYNSTPPFFKPDRWNGDQDEASTVPTFFTTYKNDRWGAFGSFTVNGGGGEVDYKDGNAVTNNVEKLINLGPFGPLSTPVGSSSLNESVFADSYYYTFTAGATYAFTDKISMALGARYVMAEKSIEADATINDQGPNPWSPADDTQYPFRADYEQDADGMGFVIGFDYKATDTLNFAMRYESEVELDFDTDLGGGNTALGNEVLAYLEKAKQLSNGSYVGISEDRNLPAVLGLGISKKLSDRLTVDTSFTYYFEEQADWDGQEDKVSNSWDFGLAGTFSVTDDFRISAGYLHTDVGISADDYDIIAQLSPPLDAHTLALGCGYDMSDKMTLEFGVMSINYVSDTANDAGTTYEYDKQNYNIAASFMYKL